MRGMRSENARPATPSEETRYALPPGWLIPPSNPMITGSDNRRARKTVSNLVRTRSCCFAAALRFSFILREVTAKSESSMWAAARRHLIGCLANGRGIPMEDCAAYACGGSPRLSSGRRRLGPPPPGSGLSKSVRFVANGGRPEPTRCSLRAPLVWAWQVGRLERRSVWIHRTLQSASGQRKRTRRWSGCSLLRKGFSPLKTLTMASCPSRRRILDSVRWVWTEIT